MTVIYLIYIQCLIFFIKKKSHNNWEISSEIFAKFFFSYLTELENKKIILLDEIGGLELNIRQVEKHIHKLLNGKIPIIGVIKSKKNKEKMKELILDETKLSEEEIRYSNLLKHPNIEIIHVNKTNQADVYSKLLKWLENNKF